MSTNDSASSDAHAVAAASLATLLQGNKRFAAEKPEPHPLTARKRTELVGGQHPIATVLGCVDARVPPELIFDQGVGDLLTVRSAGQVLTGATIGSVEFGVRSLGVPLLVVLGHTGCGAVAAALSESRPGGELGPLIDEVAERLQGRPDGDPTLAPAHNLAATVSELRHDEALVTPAGDPAVVVGLLYDMATGLVQVVDDGDLE